MAYVPCKGCGHGPWYGADGCVCPPVSGRTRLDEIVEEEWAKGDHFHVWPECRNATKRVAERAFRHGVKRQAAAMVDPMWVWGMSVQPAPAQEKTIREWGMFGHYPEARKGERRKSANWPENYVHECVLGGSDKSRPIFQPNHYGSWFYDRRSGQDRRKP